jgi:hypothetical protein
LSTPSWQPGTIYPPGAIVKRVSSPPAVATTPTNPGFESGDSGWTKDTGWGITSAGQKFSGSWAGEFNATASNRRIVNSYHAVIAAGQTIQASCQVNQGPSSAGVAGARVELDWLDASDTLISTSQGNLVDSASNNQWKQSTVSATAPPGAAKVRIAASAFRNSGSGKVWVDSFLWNYAFVPSLDSLVFKAVQANAGHSGSSEPTWPLVNGLQVVDNEVTWEAVTSSRVVWEASPILVSGSVEPTFPTQVGQTVSDNGKIIWTAVSRRVTDVNCPQSKVVTIAASKIFAGDDDIIRYSATVNPLDWTTPDDAGYLPFGLQTYGANPVAAMGLYRSNLVAFNSQGFQMWQVDQDPANNAFLDAVPVGSTYTHTWRPVANDLLGLTAVGSRNLSIAGASTNLQADGVGEPIDSLVKAKIKALARDDDPLSLFWPGAGQYWLIFGAEAFVLTINGAKKKSWSRYTFPEEITDWTLDGNTLCLRTETGKIWEMDEDTLFDDQYETLDGALLLLHNDGANGGTTFVDDSGYDRTVTAVGAAITSTTQAKFGTAALYVTGSASGLTVPHDSVFSFGSSDFSIDFWLYRTGSYGSSGDLVSKRGAGGIANTFSVYVQSNERLRLLAANPAGNTWVVDISANIDLPRNQWVHVEASRTGSTFYLYINGVSVGTTTYSGAVQSVPDAITVGYNAQIGTFDGYLDEVRIKGTGGHTANFTPPTSPYEPVAVGTDIDGVVWWPYLDMGTIGVEKGMVGLDLVATAPEGVSVSIGYNQNNNTQRTPDYMMDADSLTGQMTPFPVSGPSFDLKLTFEPGQAWEWQAANIYIQDWRQGR